MRNLVCLLLLTTISFSCMGPKEMLGDKPLVPTNFGKQGDGILLIESGQRQVNKEMETAFSKYYKGAYKLVSAVDGKKYDVSQYPLAFYAQIRETARTGSAGSRTAAGQQYCFFVIDRSEAKEYGPTNWDQIPDVLLKAYAKKLEEVRAGNKK
jgi:hypothetical protein